MNGARAVFYRLQIDIAWEHFYDFRILSGGIGFGPEIANLIKEIKGRL
jgi:hypothetical protein